MKKGLIVLVSGVAILAGCSLEGTNQVSTTDDTEIKLTTDTILTESGLATCVVALSTEDFLPPSVDCVWENEQD